MWESWYADKMSAFKLYTRNCFQNLKDQITKLEQDMPRLKKQQEEKIALQKKIGQELQQKQKADKERQDKLKQEILQQQKKWVHCDRFFTLSQPVI